MKTHAIRIHEYSGPEVLQFEEVELPERGPGEARIRHTAIGLNFIDTYHRGGLYPMELPAGLGSEAAGVVEAVYDSIGQATFFASLDALQPHGVMVSFGNASGPVEPFAEAARAHRDLESRETSGSSIQQP